MASEPGNRGNNPATLDRRLYHEGQKGSPHAERKDSPMPRTKYGAKVLEDTDAGKNVPIRLKAGEQRPYRFSLNRMVDMTLSGTYSVVVNRRVPGQRHHDGDGRPWPRGAHSPAKLVSNDLSVEITEPASRSP
jgi:hypothetical protein